MNREASPVFPCDFRAVDDRAVRVLSGSRSWYHVDVRRAGRTDCRPRLRFAGGVCCVPGEKDRGADAPSLAKTAKRSTAAKRRAGGFRAGKSSSGRDRSQTSTTCRGEDSGCRPWPPNRTGRVCTRSLVAAMILPRQAPPVQRVFSHLHPRQAARPGGFAAGRSFGLCERLEWSHESVTRCETGRITYGTVYQISRIPWSK